MDNALIGFVHVEEEKTPPYPSVVQHAFACIVDFYVMAEHRKRGVGKALLEKVKAWAVNRGLEYLELFVLEENEAGKDFYQQAGFKTASCTLRYVFGE